MKRSGQNNHRIIRAKTLTTGRRRTDRRRVVDLEVVRVAEVQVGVDLRESDFFLSLRIKAAVH